MRHPDNEKARRMPGLELSNDQRHALKVIAPVTKLMTSFPFADFRIGGHAVVLMRCSKNEKAQHDGWAQESKKPAIITGFARGKTAK
ncbi:hypothetical protein [Pseudomonas sp. Marseille-P9899]|uniref:hypothetical protein n=1 Tax=Pseudomonas sp. Marseille-P9899 TaxID=2730401 RepID=UPI00158D9C50|nr:hypothetical protein [Pseudomonas sp. Marseille-P9899]